MPLPDRPETEARDMTRYIYAIDMHNLCITYAA